MNNRRKNIDPENYVTYFKQRVDVPITLTTNGLKFWIRFHGLTSQELTDEEWKYCIDLAMQRRKCGPGGYYVGHYDFMSKEEVAA